MPTVAQFTIFGIILVTLALFIWGKWRYDLVAMFALFAVVVCRLIDPDVALQGFGHPAVLTVAAVLVVSRGLHNAGIVDALAAKLIPWTANPVMHVGVLTLAVAIFSAFMNNVGALALFLPVALATAHKHKRSPSLVLMPLAFGSILGGLLTLIGTPANIIVSSFRYSHFQEPYSLFDFTPMGGIVTLACIAFITFFSRWLIPQRADADSDSTEEYFRIVDYLIELKVTEGSSFIGQSIRKFGQLLGEDVVIVGLVRAQKTMPQPSPARKIQLDDVLVVRANPENLPSKLAGTGIHVLTANSKQLQDLQSEQVRIVEVIVTPDSSLIGHSPVTLARRSGQTIQVMAISRSGKPIKSRLRHQRFRVGDLCLLQAEDDNLQENLSVYGLIPLGEKQFTVNRKPQIKLALCLFAGSLALSVTGVLPITYAFFLCIGAYLATGILHTREIYQDIEWPIIILLAALIPVGLALEETGGAVWLANGMVDLLEGAPVWVTLGMLIATTILMSNVLNNAATAVLMVPIAAEIAKDLGANHDPFLMAVALASSCAFLTPIGHQSNTLVMSPGSYRFGDYWRLGLPLELIILFLGTPVILWLWPA